MKIILALITALFISNSIDAQYIIPSKSSIDLYEHLIFEIESDKSEYNICDTIFIRYKIRNTSDTIQRVLFKEDWPHIMGLTVSIMDDNNVSICKYSTKAVYSSQLYSEDELVEYHRFLKPGDSIKGEAVLQDIPVFKDDIIDDKIPPGKYWISLGFFQVVSNRVKIDIEKNNRP